MIEKTAGPDNNKNFTSDEVTISVTHEDNTAVKQASSIPINILIQGSIDSNPTNANITAKLSYVESKPIGSVFGVIETRYDSTSQKYNFRSNNLSVIVSTINHGYQHIAAVFENVVLQDVTHDITYSDCTLNLLATKVGKTSLICSYVITRPDKNRFIICGLHKGILLDLPKD
jgi:hypothetical protein